MSTTLGILCKKILWINQIILKMWLWMWTQVKLRIKHFCYMLLILQNSSQWKTLSIMSFTKSWDSNRIGFGPVMVKVSSPYLIKSYCNLNYIKYLSVILIFCNICCSTQVHLECTKVKISSTQQKFQILIFICVHVQNHIFKTVWLIQKIFLHELPKVEDILNQK